MRIKKNEKKERPKMANRVKKSLTKIPVVKKQNLVGKKRKSHAST